MDGYTEFFIENNRLLIHIEYYGGTARHYIDVLLSETDTEKTADLFSAEKNDLIKKLTARFSLGNAVLDFLKENGINGEVVGKGFEDGASDV